MRKTGEFFACWHLSESLREKNPSDTELQIVAEESLWKEYGEMPIVFLFGITSDIQITD
jgi:hypothetical protein